MAFVFTRVDDRAIHGQTVTLWSKIYEHRGILLIDDLIAKDPVMRNIYKNAAGSINVYIFTQEEALVKAKQAAESQHSYLLIARTPLVFEFLARNGIDIGRKITLGPVSMAPGRRTLAQFTSLNDEEIASCDYLAEQGREVIFQNIPTTAVVKWESVNRK